MNKQKPLLFRGVAFSRLCLFEIWLVWVAGKGPVACKSNNGIERMQLSDHEQRRMCDNLRKCCAITNAVFALKVAWEQSRHPQLTRAEIERRVQAGILERKEKLWTSAKV